MLKYNKCLFLEVKMEFQHNILYVAVLQQTLFWPSNGVSLSQQLWRVPSSDCNLNISFVYMHRILTVYSIAQ